MSVQKESVYEPRSRLFYAEAVQAFRAALESPPFHDSDRDQAEATAKVCAQALDSGVVPKEYLTPKAARKLELVVQYDRLNGGGSQSEAERYRERQRLSALGPIPKREEVLADNTRAIALLRDISHPVRNSAFRAAIIKLTSRPGVTGAREADALGIVIDEVETAVRLHGEQTLPLRSPETMSAEEQAQAGADMVPWPVNFALEFATALHNADDGSPEEATA